MNINKRKAKCSGGKLFNIIKVTFLIVVLGFSLNCLSQQSGGPSRDSVSVVNQADNFFAKGQKKKALKYYLFALRTDSGNLNLLNRIALCFESTKQFTKAQQYAQLALDEEASSIDALLVMARISAKNKKWSVARDFFEKVLDIQESNANARIGLVDTYIQTGDITTANNIQKQFEELLETKN